MLLRKQAIICYYIFPPHLINASTVPCETENREIVNSLVFLSHPVFHEVQEFRNSAIVI